MSELENMEKKTKPIKKKPVKVPTKRTLNLMIKEKTLASPSRLIPILLLIVVGSWLFSKYAVAARLEKVDRAEAELSEMKRQLEIIQNAFLDYDEVAEEYSRYSYDQFDKTIPDRVEVMEMLENRLFPICTIQSLTINGRDINMVIADIDMKTLTYINGMLQQEEPLIESLTISSYVDNTANDTSGKATVTATLSIRLADASNTYDPDRLEFDPDAIIAGADTENPENADGEQGEQAAETAPGEPGEPVGEIIPPHVLPQQNADDAEVPAPEGETEPTEQGDSGAQGEEPVEQGESAETAGEDGGVGANVGTEE